MTCTFINGYSVDIFVVVLVEELGTYRKMSMPYSELRRRPADSTKKILYINFYAFTLKYDFDPSMHMLV